MIMKATKWVLILFITCLAWIPLSVHLGEVAAQDQDAAGKGIYSALTTLFLLVVGGLVFGISALNLVQKSKQKVHICIRCAAWLILFSPGLVAGGVILSELIGNFFR